MLHTDSESSEMDRLDQNEDILSNLGSQIGESIKSNSLLDPNITRMSKPGEVRESLMSAAGKGMDMSRISMASDIKQQNMSGYADQTMMQLVRKNNNGDSDISDDSDDGNVSLGGFGK